MPCPYFPRGEELQELVSLCKSHTTIVLDEVCPFNPTFHLYFQPHDVQNYCEPKFYSWYIYPKEGEEYGQSLSAARYVEGPSGPHTNSTITFPECATVSNGTRLVADVNEDPVILIDGLTKNFRLPGWRVCWVIGPKNLISALSQSGMLSCWSSIVVAVGIADAQDKLHSRFIP